MMEIMLSKIQKSSLKDLVKILVKEEIGQQIRKESAAKSSHSKTTAWSERSSS